MWAKTLIVVFFALLVAVSYAAPPRPPPPEESVEDDGGETDEEPGKEWKQEIADEKQRIREEFEQEMERMKTKLESIKASREEVQEDIKKLRSHFKEQMATIVYPPVGVPGDEPADEEKAWKDIVAEEKRIREEFDAEMQRMKQKLETIKTSREEVQEEMKKVRSRFLEKLAGIADPLKEWRQKKGAEKKGIQENYDEEMQTIKKELEAIRASREEVQEEMKKCRDRFMQQMAAIAKPPGADGVKPTQETVKKWRQEIAAKKKSIREEFEQEMETLKKKLDDIRASQKEIEAKKKKCYILFKEQMANITKPPADDGVRSAKNVTVTTWKQDIAAAKKSIREEFEREMETMKKKLQEIQGSKKGVEEEMKKLRSHFREQMANITKPLHHRVRRVAQMDDHVQSRGGACPKWKAAYVEERLKSEVEAMNDTQRISVYKSIMDEVAKVDESVAAKLNACYAVSESPSKACDAFLKDVCTLVTLHDPGRVRTFLQDEAETRPDWARTFGGNATVVAKSVAKVAAVCAGLTPREKAAVRTCLGGSARMMEKVVRKAKVCATCHIDVKSGLPEFPIGGQLKFTQPLLGGPTKIEVNLSGFNDTKKHGLHVHTFNSTENQCRDCGPIFDPDPTDGERPVGDLGYIQPNARGVVKEKREDGLISLSGSHSIIGRVIDVEVNSDSEPSIACGLIEKSRCKA